jgi:hypothetical protein
MKSFATKNVINFFKRVKKIIITFGLFLYNFFYHTTEETDIFRGIIKASFVKSIEEPKEPKEEPKKPKEVPEEPQEELKKEEPQEELEKEEQGKLQNSNSTESFEIVNVLEYT